MSDDQTGTDRFELVLVLLLYVLPLGATVVVLGLVGLPGLALALLAVETVVTAAVVVAKRPEGDPRRPGTLVLALGVVAVTAGLGAVLLLASS